MMVADREAYEVDPELDEPAHHASSQMEWALREVVGQMKLDAIAVHYPVLSDDPRFPAVPFLAMAKLIGEGLGFGGEGDVTSASCVALMRQLFGVAGQLHSRPGGMFKRVGWPSGHWGSMHIEGGASAAYRREIDSAQDPEAKRQEIERKLQAISSPFRTAEAFNIEDIIDPRDTRPMLVDFVETAQPILKMQLGPTYGPAFTP